MLSGSETESTCGHNGHKLKSRDVLAQEYGFSSRNVVRYLRLPMFDANGLKCLDPKYFNIIVTDAYDVTIMSRNTGHYWYLHNPEHPEKGTVIIFHKHEAFHPYHQHGRANTLRQAVRSIQGHDKWQISGRPRRR